MPVGVDTCGEVWERDMKRETLTAMAGIICLLVGISPSLASERNLTPELSAEAAQVRRTCETHMLFRVMQDCNCHTERFIEERLAGNTNSLENVSYEVGTDCPNRPGIVDREYKACMKYVGRMVHIKIDEAEPVCRCSAESTADKIIESKARSTGAIKSHTVKSRTECGTGKLHSLDRKRFKELRK